jgi:hypothetical protein
MEQFFNLTRKSLVKPGCPALTVVDQSGNRPSGGALQRLAEDLAQLAQHTLDREAAAKLKPGKYYFFQEQERFVYLQYVDCDDIGVRCIFVDKKGRPVDKGAGVGVVTYLQYSPVSALTLMTEQPVILAED